MDNLVLNTEVLLEYLAIERDNANDLNKSVRDLEKENYEITSHTVDKNGIFKLTAKLKPAMLTSCLLEQKNVSKNDKVLPPSSGTNPRRCTFNVDGICAWHTDTTLHNGMDGVQCGLDGILYRCDDEELFHSKIVF